MTITGLRVVGVLLKSTDVVTASDLRSLCPPAISVHATRLQLWPGEGLTALWPRVKSACEIINDCIPEVIVFACASSTFAGGDSLDRAVATRIEELTCRPVITAARALIKGVQRSGMRRVLLVSPYSDDIDTSIAALLAGIGVQVMATLSIRYLEIFQPGFLSTFAGAKNRLVDPSWVHRLVLDRLKNLSAVDGVVVACTGLRISEVICDLERDSLLPVVAANQAVAAEVQRILGLAIPVHGYGRLLEVPSH